MAVDIGVSQELFPTLTCLLLLNWFNLSPGTLQGKKCLIQLTGLLPAYA